LRRLGRLQGLPDCQEPLGLQEVFRRNAVDLNEGTMQRSFRYVQRPADFQNRRRISHSGQNVIPSPASQTVLPMAPLGRCFCQATQRKTGLKRYVVKKMPSRVTSKRPLAVKVDRCEASAAQ
jgi:hypothetical protein